jgi:hypothetical protein
MKTDLNFRKITIAQDLTTSYDSLGSPAKAARVYDSQPSQQVSSRPLDNMDPLTVLESAARISLPSGAGKQHAPTDFAAPRATAVDNNYHLLDTSPIMELPNDSGYGSIPMAMQPIHDPNVFGSQGRSNSDPSIQSSFQDPWTQLGARPTSPEPQLQCPVCQKIVKSRSELK